MPIETFWIAAHGRKWRCLMSPVSFTFIRMKLDEIRFYMILVFLIEGRKLCPYLVQMAPILWLQAETMLAHARALDVSKHRMKIFEKKKRYNFHAPAVPSWQFYRLLCGGVKSTNSAQAPTSSVSPKLRIDEQMDLQDSLWSLKLAPLGQTANKHICRR